MARTRAAERRAAAEAAERERISGGLEGTPIAHLIGDPVERPYEEAAAEDVEPEPEPEQDARLAAEPEG